VAGQVDNAVALFHRNVTTGALTFGQVRKNGVSGVTGLSGARNVTISPDGTQVYAASSPPGIGAGGSVAVFSRNATNGGLTFVTAYSDGSGGLNELNGAYRVTVSPEGGHVYVAALWDQAVTAFQRSPSDGQLSLIAAYKNGSNGVSGLSGAGDVALSPEGAWLYVTSFLDNALVVFKRNPASGGLSFIQKYQDGSGGINNLGGASQIELSPAGNHLYVTASTDNAVVLFSLANPIPSLDSLSPASAKVGGNVSSIILNGEDFISNSQVKWNGVDRPTQFINSSQLSINLAPGDLNATGAANLTVVNPAPGGGVSNATPFTITPPDQNPIPSIELTNPQGVAAGDPGFTLEIKGANFMATSSAQWNGSDRPTTFISETRLEAQISSADLAAAGLAGVTVNNPAPGGGPSNTVTFDIAAPGQNPVPSIDHLNPPSIIAAGAQSSALTMEIIGTNFLDDSQVLWNGQSRPTDFVNDTTLTLQLAATEVAAAGTVSVLVQNPAPGGGDSNTVTFTVGQPGSNLVPFLTSFSVTSTGGGATLTVNGSGFVSGSKVRWNGSNRTTTFVKATQLTANLTSNDVALGSGVITVFNPSPGGGLSNELIFKQIPLYLPTVLKNAFSSRPATEAAPPANRIYLPVVVK